MVQTCGCFYVLKKCGNCGFKMEVAKTRQLCLCCNKYAMKRDYGGDKKWGKEKMIILNIL